MDMHARRHAPCCGCQEIFDARFNGDDLQILRGQQRLFGQPGHITVDWIFLGSTPFLTIGFDHADQVELIAQVLQRLQLAGRMIVGRSDLADFDSTRLCPCGMRLFETRCCSHSDSSRARCLQEFAPSQVFHVRPHTIFSTTHGERYARVSIACARSLPTMPSVVGLIVSFSPPRR